jgi:hypothetical protein
VKQDQFKAAVNESEFDIFQKLEVNDTINTTKQGKTIDVHSSADHKLSNTTLLVDNVDKINETIKDLTDLFVNIKLINIITERPKGKEDKVTTESQTNTPPRKKKVRNEKAEECTLLKWFFVCRDLRILKDQDIFAV